MDLKITIIAGLLTAALIIAGTLYFIQGGHENEMILATTTSTYDSGLLDAIIPVFEEQYDVDVKIVAVGTGQALELGRNGDADVLLVHATDRAVQFVAAGYGEYRMNVMYNQFVIVGPSDDPAGISGTSDVTAALNMIYDTGSGFCSRGDDSGTNIKEIGLWAAAGFNYTGISSESNSTWYHSLGQGMGDTLRTASEMEAYTLTDQGTFYSLENELDLNISVEGDESLFNQYGVLPVNGTMYQNVNQGMAENFAHWIVSPDTQSMIDDYTRNGHVLFTGNADAED